MCRARATPVGPTRGDGWARMPSGARYGGDIWCDGGVSSAQTANESPAARPVESTAMAHETQRRIRVGIDTGGTFTDVVAFDEDTGELVTTKTPEHPGQPRRRLHRRHREGPRRARRRPATTSPPSATAPPSRPTSCSRARSSGSASSPPRATSSSSRSPARRCPTATATPTSGSSRRASSPADRVRTVGGPARLRGQRDPALRRGGRRRRGPLVPRPRHHDDRGLLPALLRQRRARAARCARCCAASTPRPSSRSARRCCASTASTSAR